ncbi:MAG: prepilin-type N-terminal cleavage/methylation domain-containing protein [Hyphomicrobium sp.]
MGPKGMAPADEMSRREDGFTIIEVLVALTVLVMAIAVLQGGLRGGYRGQERAAHEMAALEIAKSRLAAAGIETPLTAGVTQGEAGGGYRWRVVVAPETRSGNGTSSAALRGYWTTAEVEWVEPAGAAPRKVSLTSLKIAREEAPP